MEFVTATAGKSRLSIASKPRVPVLEPIVLPPSNSFLWRCDDYPMPWSVWNHHPECEIHLIRGATGTCHVGDYIGRFEDGDLCLVGRDLPHDWVTPVAPGEVVRQRDFVLQFNEERLVNVAEHLPELSQVKSVIGFARRGLAFHGSARETGRELLEAMGTTSGLDRLALFLRLMHVLSVTKEFRVLSSIGFTPNLNAGAQGTLRRVLHHIAANYTEDVRLADLATIANMSESSFSRFFRRMTGNTFSRYLSELRTAKACELLTSTDKAVSEICYEVGYFNMSNFNRTFKAIRGMSPTQYRHLALK